MIKQATIVVSGCLRVKNNVNLLIVIRSPHELYVNLIKTPAIFHGNQFLAFHLAKTL